MLYLPHGVDYYEGLDLDEDAPNFLDLMKARRAEFREDVLQEAGLRGVANGALMLDVVEKHMTATHHNMFGWALPTMELVEGLAVLVSRE
jgi:hypothetical protein